MKRMNLYSDKEILQFEESFIQQLAEKLKSLDGVEYSVVHEYKFPTDTYRFVGPLTELGEAELRVILFKKDLVVSRVLLVHRRKGLFTNLIGWMTQELAPIGVQCIKIESVSTPEMVSWCKKNKYSIVQSTAIPVEDYVMGDYIKNLSE